MKKTKILIINTLYYPNVVGGAEKSVQLLAEKISSENIEPIIVSTYLQDYVDYVNNIKVYYLHHRNLHWINESNIQTSLLKKGLWNLVDIYNSKMFKKLEEIIQVEKPDVIHTNNLKGFSIVPWIVAKKYSLPVIHTLRDYSIMCPKSTMFKNNRNCLKRCLVCSLFTEFKRKLSNAGYVDLLIGNSNFMIAKHKELGFFKNVPSKRIFNGTEIISQINNVDRDIDNNKPLKFFYMGRIEETKGVNLLIETFEKIPQAELILAGRIYDEEIQQRVERNLYPNNIKFLGYINPKEILPNIDVLIAPSLWHEPLPRVILEAYSYGKLVIGSNRGGIPECIEEKKTGFIFNPDVKDDLRKIILYIINNRHLLKQNNSYLKSYLKQFDIKLTSEQYIKAYQSLLK
ncbi:glycosyltransferase [Geobacillus sp. LC300]|jgi:glycosyltransferase involved in cell wall biosynthesis|nr:glycosyltransferase [Geobacillus sp. LC300]